MEGDTFWLVVAVSQLIAVIVLYFAVKAIRNYMKYRAMANDPSQLEAGSPVSVRILHPVVMVVY